MLQSYTFGNSFGAMSSDSIIEHDGIITSLSGGKLYVEILSQSACSGCHAKSLCSASDMKKKLIEVTPLVGIDYRVGQRVTIVGRERMGLWATALAYGFSLVLMVVVLCLSKACGLSDPAAGALSLLSLIPYYFALYLMRDRLHKTFNFKTKIN